MYCWCMFRIHGVDIHDVNLALAVCLSGIFLVCYAHCF